MPTLVSISDKVERQLWTADEFLDWLQPGIHADLIDGEKFMRSPVNLKHADLINYVDHLLRSYIELKNLGRLYREVVAVRLSVREVFLPRGCCRVTRPSHRRWPSKRSPRRRRTGMWARNSPLMMRMV